MAHKVAMYQATYRTMLGANPSKTNHLLKTSLHNTQTSYKVTTILAGYFPNFNRAPSQNSQPISVLPS